MFKRVSFSAVAAITMVSCSPDSANTRQEIGGSLQSGSSNADGTVSTINGIAYVENGSHGNWTEQTQWRIVEEFRLGAIDGPPELMFRGPLVSIRMAPDGKLYVLDAQAEVIRVFDRAGTFVREFGGSGEGPGELASPSAMALDESGRYLWVSNGFNGRYTVFDTSGSLEKTSPRALRVLARPQHQLVFADDGTFIDEGGGGSLVQFVRVDTSGSIVDSMFTLRHPERPNFFLLPGFDRDVLQYLPKLVWSIASDGSVWHTDGGLTLTHRSETGDTLRVVKTSHRTNDIDRETLIYIEREFAKVNVDVSEYSPAMPVIEAIHILPDGHLLVQIAPEGDAEETILDVFDPEGLFLGTIKAEFRLAARSQPVVVGDTLVALGIGEMDVPFVVRSTIRRPGSQ